jgi:hypothetical protein
LRIREPELDPPVAVHGLEPAGRSGELRRPGAGDPLGEHGPVRADELHPRARLEAPFAANDADAEQRGALLLHGAPRALVQVQPPRDGLAVPEPELEGGLALLVGCKPRPTRLAGDDRPEHVFALSGRDHGRDAGGRCHLGREHLALHAAPAQQGARAQLGLTDLCTFFQQLCAGSPGRPGVHARDLGQQHEQGRADQHCHLRRQRVVVAEGDLVGRGRVVLVHDGDCAEPEELAERVPCIHVGGAVGDVSGGEQDLGRLQPLPPEGFVPHRLQPCLAERRGGLEPRHAAGPRAQSEPRQPEGDRA